MTSAPRLAAAVTSRLLRWSVVSVGLGMPMAASREPLLRGMGQQFILWGVVDGAIALAGRWANRGKPERDSAGREAAKLRRLLLINAGLDVLYVSGGAALAVRRGRRDPYWRGVGLGIVAQGSFLFGFDLWHGLQREEAA